MKFLAVLFLVGFALASAIPLPSNDIALDDGADDLDLLLTLAMEAEDDDEPTTELGKKLKEHLDDILLKIKEAIENGKTVREETVEKLKEIREKLRDMKEDMGKKAKELIEIIKEKAKDYWKKIMEKFGLEKRAIDEHLELLAEEDDDENELGKKLKKHMDEMLEKIKDAIDHGREIKIEYLEKIKEIRGKLKDMKMDFGNKAKELMDKIKEKAKDYWKKILERLTLDKRAVDEHLELLAAEVDDEPTTELGKKLKEHFDDILLKIKEAIENGKAVKEDSLEKLKELRQKMKDMRIDIGEKAKELLQKIKDGSKDYLKKILEKLGLGKRAVDEHLELLAAEDDDDIKTELGKKLRENLDEILQKLKDAIDHGKAVKEEYLQKIKEIRQKLKDVKEDIGAKAKELLQKIKEKGKDYLKQILEKLGINKRSVAHLDFNFREVLQKIKDMVKDKFDAEKLKEKVEQLFGKGSEMAEQLINMLKNKGEKAKQKILDFIDRLLDDKQERSIKDIYEKIKNYFKDLQIDLKEKFIKFGEWAKDKYEQGLEKGKTKTDNLKKLAKEFIRDTKVISKDLAEQAKEFFKEYKDDLGTVYEDVKEKVREILRKP